MSAKMDSVAIGSVAEISAPAKHVDALDVECGDHIMSSQVFSTC